MDDGILACADSLWRDGGRTERIGGQPFAMSPASGRHVLIAGNIYRIFADYLRGKQCIAFPDNFLVHLTEKEHFIPDMMVVCDRSKIKKNWVEGAPDLVVEVSSPSTARRDLIHKRKVYGECGVREYWIVDPKGETVSQYLLSDGELHPADVLVQWHEEEGDLDNLDPRERAELRPSFHCSLFPDLEIRLDDIFENLY